MRVVFYCQHVLGVGHVFRSLEITKALAGHEVVMVTGGAEVAFEPPSGLIHERLPGLMMSPDFKHFIPLEPGVTDVDEVMARRLARFREVMARYRPDVLLVELFPFGRRAFRFELVPILQGVKAGEWGPCKAVCSVRDILVEKPDPAKYARRVLDLLNPYFHAVLVHADPTLITLDETFPAMGSIVPPVRYTGYVAQGPAPGAGPALRRELGRGGAPFIVASAGGGQVGGEVLRSAIQASVILARTRPHALAVFTGPYASDRDFDRCLALADGHDHITVERFTTRFPDYLDAADLSVSLGGYNTTMNLLAAGTYGLLYPFDQNREQAMRTARLRERGAVGLLTGADLCPGRLASLMAEALNRPPAPCAVNIDGGAATARILEELAG
jgi:predicted glycosyltransferase